jgi:hypothetical protein
MKPRLPFFRLTQLGAALLVALLSALPAVAKIQFDVFAGYGDASSGYVRTGGWFPIGFEVMNDGPSFDAVIEVSSGQLSGQTLRVSVELPTNTRKRLVIPAFSTASSVLMLDGRLLDTSGRVRAEAPQLRLNLATWEMPMLGALPASHAGLPTLPTDRNRRSDFQPVVARLQPAFMPDNPIALEGLNALYLNSQRALELKEPQVNALLAWVFSGGHLIVAVDQAADFNSAPWLRGILPGEVSGVANQIAGPALSRWTKSDAFRPRHGFEPPTGGLETHQASGAQNDVEDDDQDPYRRLDLDARFNAAEQPVLALRNRDGRITIGAPDAPLALTANRGRGLVTLLAVNPEREPFKSWQLRPWFFAKLIGVSPALLRNDELNLWGGRGLDSVFGAMIETQQIRKLPVGFLLLLLLVYLVVIGPFDQWWLKKINRPMLTWITFPSYVALFSLLIYFIGFKLRSGQREWNELHVVDVIPQGNGSQVALRGHSFASIYSPANETYRFETKTPLAAVRSEFGNVIGASIDSGRVAVRVKATGVEADVFVPVWTSQLNVAEWLDFDTPPLTAVSGAAGNPASVRVSNQTKNRFTTVWVVDDAGYLHRFGELAAGATVDHSLQRGRGEVALQAFTAERTSDFQAAVSRRDSAFGSNERARLDDWPGASVAASFGAYLSLNNGESRDFVWPNGLDLTGVVRRGDLVVLAWMENASLIPPLNQFSVTHQKQGTLLRLVIPAR